MKHWLSYLLAFCSGLLFSANLTALGFATKDYEGSWLKVCFVVFLGLVIAPLWARIWSEK